MNQEPDRAVAKLVAAGMPPELTPRYRWVLDQTISWGYADSTLDEQARLMVKAARERGEM